MIKNYTFKSIEDATEEVKRQVAMNKALKQILFGIGALLIIFVILTFTGCSTASASPAGDSGVAEEKREHTSSALLANVGDTVTVNGITYTAAEMWAVEDRILVDANHATFYVNRANNHILLKYSFKYDRSAVVDFIDTGLVWEGPVYVGGSELNDILQPTPDVQE